MEDWKCVHNRFNIEKYVYRVFKIEHVIICKQIKNKFFCDVHKHFETYEFHILIQIMYIYRQQKVINIDRLKDIKVGERIVL